jgi:ATP-dependent DNA helicase RecQ
MAAVRPENQALYEALRAWRRQTAAEQGVPPYVIFHDRTLAEIALFRPATLSDLTMIGGVGQAKLDHYGQAVLKVVREN